MKIAYTSYISNLWHQYYSFAPNCRSGGDQIASFGKKDPHVHLIIIGEWPEKKPPILKNLDNFPPGAFYLNPLQLYTKE